MYARMIATAFAFSLAAGGAYAQTQTSPQIQVQPKPQLTQPKLKVAPQVVPQLQVKPSIDTDEQVGSGVRTANLDVYWPGVTEPTDHYSKIRTYTPVPYDLNGSVLLIRSRIHLGDLDQAAASASYKARILELEQLPPDCKISVSSAPQSKHVDLQYLQIIKIINTHSIPECYKFFNNLNVITLRIASMSYYTSDPNRQLVNAAPASLNGLTYRAKLSVTKPLVLDTKY